MRTFAWVVIPLAVVTAVSTGEAKKKPVFRDVNPVIFVHGGSGSGAQFESQAMRFTSNGYPAGHIGVVEYDSGTLSPADSAEAAFVYGLIDARIAQLQAATGKAQVDLMGHSLGTTFSHGYLADPARAAKVAHYVNIDGRTAAAPPGGVPTLALWAGAVNRPTPPQIAGAENVTIPNQEHVEVATSPEAFAEMFEFLLCEPPATTDIVREVGAIQISGRAVTFPDNTAAAGATVEVWRLRPRTGQRWHKQPREVLTVAADGTFSFTGRQKNFYEFVLKGVGSKTLHYFYERFPRSDHLVRLNAAPALEPFFPASSTKTGLAVLRYKEYWGDRGTQNDVLTIDGTNVINPTNSPSGQVGAASVAFFAFDAGGDDVTNLTTIPTPFGPLPFLTGADLVIPVNQAPLSITTVPRGNQAAARTLNIRRISGNDGRVVVQLHDFEQ